MDIKIKKKLVKNWFISLQEIICSEIIKIEKKMQNSKLKNGKEMIQRMKVEENPES